MVVGTTFRLWNAALATTHVDAQMTCEGAVEVDVKPKVSTATASVYSDKQKDRYREVTKQEWNAACKVEGVRDLLDIATIVVHERVEAALAETIALVEHYGAVRALASLAADYKYGTQEPTGRSRLYRSLCWRFGVDPDGGDDETTDKKID